MSTVEQETKNRTRKLNQEKKEISTKPPGHKTICLPIGESEHKESIADPKAYRELIDRCYENHPELFPTGMSEGYTLHDMRKASAKLPDVQQRRIKLKSTEEAYTIRPSFVLPYMMGYTNDVENGLLLLNHGVPYWLVTAVCGKDDMYWERLEISFGRNSLVGTTVNSSDILPEDMSADEKHTKNNGEKVYIATTVAGECVLGASVSPSAGAKDLTSSYGQFKTEALNVDPNYQPKTVNTDGWSSTINAWNTLFPTITTILCFLHSFIKIRSCGKRLGDTYFELCDKVWAVYHAATETEHDILMADLAIWALHNLPDGPALEATIKLCCRFDKFSLAYSFPNAHRTSNMVDRHMDPMNRYLFAGKYFHGHLMTAEFRIRGWALIHNFRPFCPRSNPAKQGFQSRAHRLNGSVYHHHWLHNLLISSSMAGFRA